jgi:hypothetical protein
MGVNDAEEVLMLRFLQHLGLTGTAISHCGIERISTLPGLEELVLIARLKQALSECTVIRDERAFSQP